MLLIDAAPIWLAGTNCYVVAPEAGGPGVVVDVPPGLSELEVLLRRHDIAPVALLITHGHIDHVGGAGAAAAALASVAYLHPDDEWLANDPGSQLRSLMGMSLGAEQLAEFAPATAFEALGDGQTLTLAGMTIEVLHTPGHTPGHCCFSLGNEGLLFSGDQLFAGSIGRTDLPGGSHSTLMESMRSKILPLEPDTRVLPGHGPATTLGREFATNPFLQGI